MMPSKILRGPGTELFQIPIPMLDIAQPTIPFERMPPLEKSLVFQPSLSMSHSRKRGRAAADVDCEHSCMQKKKRRLRLFLITSRLSPQFSHPATNIVDRGSSRIAHWAKQTAAGRNLLPKAAILNRIRRGAVAARDAVSRRRLLVEQEKEQQQLELARLAFDYGAIHTYTRPVHSPTEPVPAGATMRDADLHPVPHSLSASPSTSPITSRSPSPTSTSASSAGLAHDNPPYHKSPNAAYALSPPRTQPSTRTYEPHLPSPLGLSNYDAFDEVSGPKPSSEHTYSQLDDEDTNNEDHFSFLWTEDEEYSILTNPDTRHDSPFSPSTAQICASPEPPAQPAAPRDEEGSAFSAGDSWPPSGPKSISKIQTPAGFTAHMRFGGFEAGQLAVQYPGAPVACEEREEEVKVKPVLRKEMVPACMSPNFMAADVDWGSEKEEM